MKTNIDRLLLLIGVSLNIAKSFVFPYLEINESNDLKIKEPIVISEFDGSAFNNLVDDKSSNNTMGYVIEQKSKKILTVSVSSAELETVFVQYGQEYGVNPEVLSSIAYCESTHNPMATNYIYAGLFQFSPSTWESTRNQMGLDPNPELRFNPSEAVKTAAFKISKGGIGAWPTCGKRVAQA